MRDVFLLEALRTLGITEGELADEFGIDKRTVFRWIRDHPTHLGRAAVTAILRLHALGIPWRRNEVAIGFDGPISDYDAVVRFHSLPKVQP